MTDCKHEQIQGFNDVWTCGCGLQGPKHLFRKRPSEIIRERAMELFNESKSKWRDDEDRMFASTETGIMAIIEYLDSQAGFPPQPLPIPQHLDDAEYLHRVGQPI
jgi:hypothetical protein